MNTYSVSPLNDAPHLATLAMATRAQVPLANWKADYIAHKQWQKKNSWGKLKMPEQNSWTNNRSCQLSERGKAQEQRQHR